MIEIGEVITLDNDKEYICITAKEHNGSRYLFLMSNFKPLEIRFAKELDDGKNIEVINNQKEKTELFQLFQDVVQNN